TSRRSPGSRRSAPARSSPRSVASRRSPARPRPVRTARRRRCSASRRSRRSSSAACRGSRSPEQREEQYGERIHHRRRSRDAHPRRHALPGPHRARGARDPRRANARGRWRAGQPAPLRHDRRAEPRDLWNVAAGLGPLAGGQRVAHGGAGAPRPRSAGPRAAPPRGGARHRRGDGGRLDRHAGDAVARARRAAAVPPAGAPPTGAEPAAPADEAVDEGWEDYDDQGPPASPEPAAAAGPPGAYSFASSMVDGAVEEIDPDLAAVFAEEASSTLDMLDGALASLRTNLDDRTLLKSIERGFHTLKGAAATVGLAEVSARASDLQDRAELLVDEGRPLTSDEAIALVRHAAALRRLAGIPAAAALAIAPPPPAVSPPVALPPPPPSSSPSPRAFDEVAAEFERDARVALDEAEHLLG